MARQITGKIAGPGQVARALAFGLVDGENDDLLGAQEKKGPKVEVSRIFESPTNANFPIMASPRV